MCWLALGVLTWSGVHLLRSIAGSVRARLIASMGQGTYRGAFAFAILASLALMIIGWRAAAPVSVYQPPGWGRAAAVLLMLLAFILFAASAMATNIKRFVRHPQLTGVLLWSMAHLLSNGDGRSLVLFGVLGLWALAEMRLISRREGPWRRPDSQPLRVDLKPLLAGVIGYLVFFVAHPYLFGVSPTPL
jgi:uncharacterized membrane protein